MRLDDGFKYFGKNVQFSVSKNNSRTERFGKIVGVVLEGDKIKLSFDEDGYINFYLLDDILIFVNEDNRFISEIVNSVNINISELNYDYSSCQQRLIEIASQITGLETRKIIEGVNANVKLIDSKKNNLEAGIFLEKLDEYNKLYIQAIIAYQIRQKDILFCTFRDLWLYNHNLNNLDIISSLILVSEEMKNELLSFYFLKQYFSNLGHYDNRSDYAEFWWRHLNYSLKYGDFNTYKKLKVGRANVFQAFETFTYIFKAYNMEHIALTLSGLLREESKIKLGKNRGDFKDIDDAIELLNIYKNYIPMDTEGHYKRFERCIEQIKYLFLNSEDDFGNSGYVYEYIEAQQYGFIVGFDFQTYFFRKENLNNDVYNRIINSIHCSHHIYDETYIRVMFDSETTNNRSNRAYNIK